MKYLTKIDQLEQLSTAEKTKLKQVTEKFAFRSNEYYLSLIDWNDPDDPIRTIIVPNLQELDKWGRLDPSNEKAYCIMPGLEHKYHSTALLLISNRLQTGYAGTASGQLFINPRANTCGPAGGDTIRRSIARLQRAFDRRRSLVLNRQNLKILYELGH
jgi:hypothetical protein